MSVRAGSLLTVTPRLSVHQKHFSSLVRPVGTGNCVQAIALNFPGFFVLIAACFIIFVPPRRARQTQYFKLAHVSVQNHFR